MELRLALPLVLSAGGILTWTENGVSETAPYTVSGNTITVVFGTDTDVATYVIVLNQLTLTTTDNSDGCTRVEVFYRYLI